MQQVSYGESGLSPVAELISIYEQEDDAFRSLDPRFIDLDVLSGLIFASVVTLAFVGAMIFWALTDQIGWLWWSACGAGCVIVASLFWFGLFWPKREFLYTAWRLDDVGLEIRRGVVWRQQVSVPVARVQHADVTQGPLQRRYGLGTLTVHTAGTQNASVVLGGLAHESAIELRDRIIRQREVLDVV